MFAVIKTGGKQYRVKEGDILSVENLEAEPGQVVNFDQVLLLEDGDKIQVGAPFLEKALVKAEIVENYKGEKVIVFKKKRRKGYRRKKGHRQLLSKVKITGIYPGEQASQEEKEAMTPAPPKPTAKAKAKSETKEKPKAKPEAKKGTRSTKTVAKKATTKATTKKTKEK
ncbi:MAG: 50S ribosomal protein L21 [Acidobacteriota bacterium]|nr:50S ribosomal protein L21 [Acidobacteriota bacterium]MDW3228269.1 50S ribosomal protein L21 [Acidobacteriota bacterium]MDY0230988.1 50S ribosomal protein L21 [Candidatus Saccharicenans sp.]